MEHPLLALIPKELYNISGSVFYSGIDAFIGKKPLYILGLNPGGDPKRKSHLTLKYHTCKNSTKTNWSEYRDESWNTAIPGTSFLQCNVLHLLNNLNIIPSEIPASNLIFVRTKNEHKLRSNFKYYADLCWPFHEYVINSQNIKSILCFGKSCSNYVKGKITAYNFIDEYVETNNRNWKTQIFSNDNGIKVIMATHPSRANWTNPNSDPSQLIINYV